MHELAPVIAAWRCRLGRILPRRWSAPHPAAAGLRARRLSPARMELDPASLADSWAAWELSRDHRPAEQSDLRSEQREG